MPSNLDEWEVLEGETEHDHKESREEGVRGTHPVRTIQCEEHSQFRT